MQLLNTNTLFHRRRRSSASLSGSSSSSSSSRSRSPPKKPPKRTSSPPRKMRRLSPSASPPRRRHRPSPPATPPPKTRHSPTPQQSNRTRKSRVSVSPGRTSGKGKNQTNKNNISFLHLFTRSLVNCWSPLPPFKVWSFWVLFVCGVLCKLLRGSFTFSFLLWVLEIYYNRLYMCFVFSNALWHWVGSEIYYGSVLFGFG